MKTRAVGGTSSSRDEEGEECADEDAAWGHAAHRRRLGAARPQRRRVWQEEYFDHRVLSDEGIQAIVEYVHANPVRKGLCSIPEDWPWSTANERFRGWIEVDYMW